MQQHKFPVRVYYQDTDALGIVHHATFIRYFELARTEALRTNGLTLPQMASTYQLQFAVTKLEVQYKSPAYLDEELTVVTEVTKLGRSVIEYKQLILRGDTIICEALVQLVTVANNLRPKALPAAMRKEIR